MSGSAVGLRLGQGKVEAVITNDGEIACDALLIAAGPCVAPLSSGWTSPSPLTR